MTWAYSVFQQTGPEAMFLMISVAPWQHLMTNESTFNFDDYNVCSKHEYTTDVRLIDYIILVTL